MTNLTSDFVKIENFSPSKDNIKRMKGKIQIGRRKWQFVLQMYVYYVNLVRKNFYFKKYNSFE